MRYVLQKSSLAQKQPFEALRHVIERPRQQADLVPTLERRTHRQIALPASGYRSGNIGKGHHPEAGRKPAKYGCHADDEEVVGGEFPSVGLVWTDGEKPVTSVRRSGGKDEPPLDKSSRQGGW